MKFFLVALLSYLPVVAFAQNGINVQVGVLDLHKDPVKSPSLQQQLSAPNGIYFKHEKTRDTPAKLSFFDGSTHRELYSLRESAQMINSTERGIFVRERDPVTYEDELVFVPVDGSEITVLRRGI